MANLFLRQMTKRYIRTASIATASKVKTSSSPAAATMAAMEPLQEDTTPKMEYPSIASLHKGDFFNLKDAYTLEDLMESRVHYGHKEGMLDPHMRPYIFGKRLGVLIFDLERTAKLLDKALRVIAEIAYRKGIILLVHQSRQTGHLVEAVAKECGEYAYCRRWNGAIFSDSRNKFGAITRLPDLVVLFSVVETGSNLHGAVTMSARMLIPTVGVCDTNADPTLVTYPIPGNDDTPESIELYCRLVKKAISNGKRKREEMIEKYGVEFYNKTLEVEPET